ncbi:MAG: 2-amino-4-hydroxy-6-hydroxymethyldihydropteridine diphosphokinase [Kiloniellaceae bacterium]
MILVALGSNLVSAQFRTSEELLAKAIKSLETQGVEAKRRSSWYRSAPVPPSDQPWFVNGVIEVATVLEAPDLLALLHEVEAEYGRIRAERNASRTLDLDLLAYHDQIYDVAGGLVLPHPRLHERAFVLLPLREIASEWRHPVTGRTAGAMLAELPPGQAVERIP